MKYILWPQELLIGKGHANHFNKSIEQYALCKAGEQSLVWHQNFQDIMSDFLRNHKETAECKSWADNALELLQVVHTI